MRMMTTNYGNTDLTNAKVKRSAPAVQPITPSQRTRTTTTAKRKMHCERTEMIKGTEAWSAVKTNQRNPTTTATTIAKKTSDALNDAARSAADTVANTVTDVIPMKTAILMKTMTHTKARNSSQNHRWRMPLSTQCTHTSLVTKVVQSSTRRTSTRPTKFKSSLRKSPRTWRSQKKYPRKTHSANTTFLPKSWAQWMPNRLRTPHAPLRTKSSEATTKWQSAPAKRAAKYTVTRCRSPALDHPPTKSWNGSKKRKSRAKKLSKWPSALSKTFANQPTKCRNDSS